MVMIGRLLFPDCLFNQPSLNKRFEYAYFRFYHSSYNLWHCLKLPLVFKMRLQLFLLARDVVLDGI